MTPKLRWALAILGPLALGLAFSPVVGQTIQRMERPTISTATLAFLRQQPPSWVFKVQAGRLDSLQVRDMSSVTLDSTDQMAVISRGEGLLPDEWVSGQVAFPAAGPTLSLPEDYLVRVEGNEATIVRPLLKTGQPMRFEEESGRFHGVLWIVLRDETHPSEPRLITPPLSLRVASAAESVNPSELRLDSTNVVSRVAFEARNPLDSVDITLITDRQPDGYQAHIPVEPALLIETPGRTLQGWGIQSVPITVVVRGVTLEEPVAVTLQASKGSVTPKTVYVSTAQAGSAELRSEGLGSAELLAVSPMFVTARRTFSFGFPFSYILFALVGAIMGGLLAHWTNLKNEKPSNLGRNLGGAVVWGVVVSAVYIGLEVNLLAVVLPVVSTFNEIIVFSVSALAGLMWARAGEKKPPPN